MFFGWFRQNSLLRLEKGQRCRSPLDAVPGVIFRARSKRYCRRSARADLAAGQPDSFRPGERSPGRVAVAITITDSAFENYTLPSGAFGQAAVYSEHFHHVAIMRRVLLRMAAWMNYVFRCTDPMLAAPVSVPTDTGSAHRCGGLPAVACRVRLCEAGICARSRDWRLK